jgi:hypothetical protein
MRDAADFRPAGVFSYGWRGYLFISWLPIWQIEGSMVFRRARWKSASSLENTQPSINFSFSADVRISLLLNDILVDTSNSMTVCRLAE